MKFLLVLSTVLFGSYATMACKCVPSTLADDFNRAGEVFHAKVNGRQFEVIKVFKGTVGNTVPVPAAKGTSCDVRFEDNQSYLIFSNQGSTGSCSGNRKNPDETFLKTIGDMSSAQ